MTGTGRAWDWSADYFQISQQIQPRLNDRSSGGVATATDHAETQTILPAEATHGLAKFPSKGTKTDRG